MKQDIIRVLRVIEYVGPRAAVEKQVANSKHGDHDFGDVKMKVATVGQFPEVLQEPVLRDAEINVMAMNTLKQHFSDTTSWAYLLGHTDEYFRSIGLRVRDIKEIRGLAS